MTKGKKTMTKGKKTMTKGKKTISIIVATKLGCYQHKYNKGEMHSAINDTETFLYLKIYLLKIKPKFSITKRHLHHYRH